MNSKIIQELQINNVITKSGNLNKVCSNVEKFIKPKNLYDLYDRIVHVTSFLPKNASYPERIYNVWHLLSEVTTCKMCCNRVTFMSFSRGYRTYCSHKCYSSDLDRPGGIKVCSEEVKKEAYAKMVKARKEKGSYTPSAKTKEKMSKSAKKTMHKKRKTCLEKYGVDNPGVLASNSSKSAREFINSFLSKRGISKSRCMYDDGHGLKEFWQNITLNSNSKKRFTCYDLVVFKTESAKNRKLLSEIELVLEYNGPWHYEDDGLTDLSAPATPYPNSVTIKESIELDTKKRAHLAFVEDYYVYWEKSSKLVKVPAV